jgi:hypothetical protein
VSRPVRACVNEADRKVSHIKIKQMNNYEAVQ